MTTLQRNIPPIVGNMAPETNFGHGKVVFSRGKVGKSPFFERLTWPDFRTYIFEIILQFGRDWLKWIFWVFFSI